MGDRAPAAVNRAALPAHHRIATLAALRTVSDDRRHRILELLIAEPLGARTVAARLRMARTRVYYHLKLLEKHGFIVVVEERVVARRLERIYRAVARGFRVDPALIGGGSPEVAQARERILENTLDDLRARGLPPRPRDGTLVARTFLQLRPAQLAELRRRLAELIDDFAPTDGDGEGLAVELAVALFRLR
jgi:DNA-binding transcriptional ArsR family regulator